jgi:hypothetical protein
VADAKTEEGVASAAAADWPRYSPGPGVVLCAEGGARGALEPKAPPRAESAPKTAREWKDLLACLSYVTS